LLVFIYVFIIIFFFIKRIKLSKQKFNHNFTMCGISARGGERPELQVGVTGSLLEKTLTTAAFQNIQHPGLNILKITQLPASWLVWKNGRFQFCIQSSSQSQNSRGGGFQRYARVENQCFGCDVRRSTPLSFPREPPTSRSTPQPAHMAHDPLSVEAKINKENTANNCRHVG